MEELKEELRHILANYMDILIYTEVLLGYCEYNFEEKYVTPILKCLETIYELNNKNFNELDLLILKMHD